ELGQTEAFYDAAWAGLIVEVGLIADADVILREVEETRVEPPADIYWVSKIHLETKWFRDFNRGRLPNWELLPPHTRIGIDLKADPIALHRVWDWRLLEAALFEDLAMLWNEIVTGRILESPE